MRIFKDYKTNKKFSKFIIIIFSIINLLIITSCTLTNLKKNNIITFTEKTQPLRKLIVPKGITIPSKNKAYDIPYTKKDLETKNYNIFPPI